MSPFWIGFVCGLGKLGAIVVEFPKGLKAIRRGWREVDKWASDELAAREEGR